MSSGILSDEQTAQNWPVDNDDDNTLRGLARRVRHLERGMFDQDTGENRIARVDKTVTRIKTILAFLAWVVAPSAVINMVLNYLSLHIK